MPTFLQPYIARVRGLEDLKGTDRYEAEVQAFLRDFEPLARKRVRKGAALVAQVGKLLDVGNCQRAAQLLEGAATKRPIGRAVVLAGIFLTLAVGSTVVTVQKITRGRASVAWPSTEGRIIASGVVISNPGNKSVNIYEPAVSYRYEVDGQAFTGFRINFQSDTGNSYADRIVATYPPGKVVAVFYDPAQPREATLKRGSGTMTYTGFVWVGAFLLLAIGAFVTLRG